MTIVGGSTVASSGMASADRHGASRIFSVKLLTDLGVFHRAYWTHHLTIASARSRRSSSPASVLRAVTPALGKRVIALAAALYADAN